MIRMYSDTLTHYGVKGQKWGVRRYQYADGTLTPAGKKRRNAKQSTSKTKSVASLMSMEVKHLTNKTRTHITGKQYVDGYLKEGTSFSRIQTSKEFNRGYAFYATYKKADTQKYMGLFGKNLTSRAAADAKLAEKKAETTGRDEDIATAKQLRDKANNLKVYQVKLETSKKLKIPSDENAGDITAKLLEEPEFKKNLVASIQDSKAKMRRPSQQILFKQAENALAKDPSKMIPSEKVAVYKALNLSLTFHNPQQIAAQDRFYGELKKKGYNAVLDYNDKQYSSYHAKRPMIVFDTDPIKLQSIAETNPELVNAYYRRYNTERIAKEVVENGAGLVSKFGTKTLSECNSYMNRKMDDYLKS